MADGAANDDPNQDPRYFDPEETVRTAVRTAFREMQETKDAAPDNNGHRREGERRKLQPEIKSTPEPDEPPWA
jgi:hypothetical protein